MDKYRLLLNKESFMTRVVIMQANNVEYFFLHKENFATGVGNIYKGKVEKVMSGINAAFVNIGGKKSGFLPFLKEDALYLKDEIEKKDENTAVRSGLRNGDEIMVQITKPHSESKGMKLTTKISLPGRFLIMLPFSTQRAISRKINDKAERDRLLKLVDSKIKAEVGFIIRTAAEGKDKKYIEREIKVLLGQWRKITRYNKVKKAPSLLWEEAPIHIRVLRDYVTDEFDEIVSDDLSIFKAVKKYTGLFVPEMARKLQYHKSPLPLFERYNIESTLESFLTNKIYLPSRGYLIIEEAETLNAIDVNTGGSGRESFSKTILNTNMEAAREIPRQIRVRNLSGLIIVDLIDMKDQKQRKKVFKEFNKNLEIDKANIEILSISKLGLVEMSREKTEFKLSDILLEKCEKCDGSGYVKRLELTALKLKTSVMNGIADKTKSSKISVEVSSLLYDFFWEENRSFLNYIRKKGVVLRSNKELHKDEFTITRQ